MLVVVTIFNFLYYLLYGVSTRLRGEVPAFTDGIYLATLGITALVVAFQPAAVLFLLQQRGSVLQASKGNTISPFSSSLGKKIVDWVLVGLTFIVYIAYMGNVAAYATAADSGFSSASYLAYLAASRGLAYAGAAIFLLLCINVITTSIVLFVQAKQAQWIDLVTRYICLIIVPFFTVYGLESFIFTIYFGLVTFRSLEAGYTAVLVDFIIRGFIQLAITTLLIVTMSLPGVEWVPAGGPSSYLDTTGKWSNGKPEGNHPVFVLQPPYHQQEQPPWNQQQLYHQQQPYYQQQQPQQQ